MPTAKEVGDLSMGKWRRNHPRAYGYAALDPKGQIIVNSIRGSMAAVRLAAGECRPVRVTIVADDIT